VIGHIASVDYLKVLDFQPFVTTYVDNFSFQSILDYPKFFFLKAIEAGDKYPLDAAAIGNIALIFVPIGVVELAQHISDHKNLSNIINKDLITEPGLDNTLLGDGVGSIVGGFFGGCANTTYGESIGCVAITGNASIVSILTAALGCMVLSFFTPFVVLINTIPKCVMGGACIALYGFIAVSGLQMLKRVDLGNNKNLFIVSAILVCGIGGLTFDFGFNAITNGPLFSITALAAALIVGIVTNLIVNNGHLSSGEEQDGLSASSESMGEAYDKETAEEADGE
jgi:uracil permease